MKEVALETRRVIFPDEEGKELVDISAASGRYSMFKVGPVLCINHHIGASPLGVVLHETFNRFFAPLLYVNHYLYLQIF